MTTLPLPRGARRNRLTIVVIVTAVLLAGYILLLNHEERLMAQYYKDLRQSHPQVYLAKIMQARGFRMFLQEYESMHDLTKPSAKVPTFLIGRWALFDKAKRVSDEFVPKTCLSGLEIEDGHLSLFGEGAMQHDATYTMAGNKVTAHLSGGGAATIGVIGYGSHLHHIEVMLPGHKDVQYGYMCR